MTFQILLEWAVKSGITVTACLGAAYLLFRWLGVKYVEKKFAEQLEHVKHQQNRDLERVRFEIQSMFSRISKVHEREFEVLPKAWFMLHDANGAAWNTSKMLKEYANVEAMSKESLDEFLQSSDLSPVEQNEVRSAANKQACYCKLYDQTSLAIAKKKQRLLNNYLIEHSLFMPEALAAKMTDASKALWSGLLDYELGTYYKDGAQAHKGSKLIATVTDLLPPIGTAIKECLCYDAAATPQKKSPPGIQ